VIAVLLMHPEYAEAIPASLARLQPAEQLTLRVFYTAAMLLQHGLLDQLRPHLAERWRWLPDIFSADLGIPPTGMPHQRLLMLGQRHRQRTGAVVNWAGTYKDVARRLLRQWEVEATMCYSR
jgi:hypothetical protein